MTVATKKLVLDVREAGESILQIPAGKNLAEHARSRILRRAVEREFEIIGGALNRLAQIDPATAASVSQLRRIVDFRNRIIHGYGTINDHGGLSVIEQNLSSLIEEIGVLLEAEEAR